MIRHRKQRSDIIDIPHVHIGHRIRKTNKGFVRGARLHSVPCHTCGIECVKAVGEINRSIKTDSSFCCSDFCRRDPKHSRICPICNKSFRVKVGKLRPNSGKFCSKVCYSTWQETDANKGKNHPNYKNGYDRDVDRKHSKYKRWRNSVYHRDDYTCRICLVKGGSLHGHHVKIWSKFPEDRYEIDNGVTLCIKCHKDLHRGQEKI